MGRFLAVVCVVLGAACVEPIASVSDAPAPGGAKLTQLSDAFAARFTLPERSPRLEAARHRLVGGALVPSRIYDDSTAWSVMAPTGLRTLAAQGTLTDRGYRFELGPDRPAPLKVGDTRHSVVLRRLADSEFRWDTNVDFAIGALTANDVAEMITQLLSASHDHDGPALHAAARVAFPRSTATLGKVFSIDSLTTRPSAQGTTMVALTLGVHGDGLRATQPHFADYLEKYVATSRYRFALTDRNGALYFEATGADHRLTVHYRVKAGAMVSYLGPPRPLPDSLRLTSDLSIHVKLFQVGWKNLVTDFTIARGDHSHSWTMVAQREPDWQLPLITERLLRSPLRRPFQGDGAFFELAVSDSAGAQTLFIRRGRLEVKESQILRFLGGLVSRVLDDLDTTTEHEEATYFREIMVAFEQDVRAVRPK